MADTNLTTTTPTRFTVIRPELLPAMQLLQSFSTEDNISARMAKFKALWAGYDPPYAAQYDVEGLEFDPIKIQAELGAFFEMLLRDRVNQAVRGVTLAFSIGSDVDAIGSRYPYGVERLDLDGDGVPDETDARYKLRLWNSPSIFSLSGPGQGVYESYVFWALSAPMPTGSKPLRHAAALTKRGTGVVTIVIMVDDTAHVSRRDAVTGRLVTEYSGNPFPTADQITAVYRYIADPKAARKGLTDVLNVVGPKVNHTKIRAKVWSFPGVDPPTLMADIQSALIQLVEDIRWIGADLTILSIDTAIGQAGTYNRTILEPAADIIVGQDGCVNVTAIELEWAGVGE